jgi:hypothetical protein
MSSTYELEIVKYSEKRLQGSTPSVLFIIYRVLIKNELTDDKYLRIDIVLRWMVRVLLHDCQ